MRDGITVMELIEKLRTMPPDTEVVMNIGDDLVRYVGDVLCEKIATVGDRFVYDVRIVPRLHEWTQD